MEAILGILLLVIVIGLGVLLYNVLQSSLPSEEICDQIDNDLDGEVDEGFAITCRQDLDCGESGFYGQRFCRDGNIWQEYLLLECRGDLGTCESNCFSRQESRQVQRCSDGCQNGACL